MCISISMACNSEAKKNKEIIPSKMDNEMDLNDVNAKEAKNEKSEEVSNLESNKKEILAAQTTKNETNYKIKPPTESKISQELVEKKINTSVNKTKSCNDIIEEYKGIINLVSKNKTTENISKLSQLIKDPFYIKCKKSDPNFSKKIKELERSL